MSSVITIILLVLVLLIVAMLAMAVFSGNNGPAGGSIVAKDNTLRYEAADYRKTRRRNTVDIRNVDMYLNKYEQLYIFDGFILTKKDDSRKCNIHNLLLRKDDGTERTLAEIYADDPELYGRVCRFLEFIENRSADEIYWHINGYKDRFVIVEDGSKIVSRLSSAKRKIKDRQINDRIDEMSALIKAFESKTGQITALAKAKRFYEVYLDILCGAVENYSVLEKDGDIKRTSESKQKLLETFTIIEKALPQVYSQDAQEEMDGQETVLEQILLNKSE